MLTVPTRASALQQGDGMGIRGKIQKEGVRVGMKAMSKIMESPDRAEKVMKVLQGVQKGREKLDETTGNILHMGQIPSKDDVKQLSREVGRLKREAKKIMVAIEDIEERLDLEDDA